MTKFKVTICILSVIVLHSTSTANTIRTGRVNNKKNINNNNNNNNVDIDKLDSSFVPKNYYTVNNIPRNLTSDCEMHFECKRKLRQAEVPKPCIKFCIKYIQCGNDIKIRGQPDQCVELNEQLVMQEYNDCKRDNDSDQVQITQVAMIDFPCQPGYLPDSRGRCREIW